MLEVRFVVVVKKDELNEDGFVDEISEYGTVWSREDGDIGEPVRLLFVRSDFGRYTRFKLKYNCAEPRQFVLFPMASLEDKMKIEKEWG